MPLPPSHSIPTTAHCRHPTHIQPVKQVILWLLALDKQLEVLEHLPIHWDPVLVANGILAKEVKLHHTLLAIQGVMQCWGVGGGSVTDYHSVWGMGTLANRTLTDVLHSK